MPEAVVIGVLATEGVGHGLAEALTDELPAELGERFPDVEWRAELVHAEPAEPAATQAELLETVRSRLLQHGWELAVGLTELPLRSGRRPVSAAASATHGVGVVSVPALGAVGVKRRLKNVVLHVVEGLLGESVGADGVAGGREDRMTRRLRELASPIGVESVNDDGWVRFAGATLRGNIRLLVGLVRANEPSRVVARLSRALVGALGTAAFALASTNVWQLADGVSWTRLAALSGGSIVATCLALVLAHGLWERARGRAERERVLLFNLATSATIVLAVLTLFASLLALTTLGAAGLISPALLTDALRHDVGVLDYLRLCTLIAALATIGGALGSLMESDLAVRNAAYTTKEDERTEGADVSGS
jgi:uncharacterized membrane protein